MHIFTYQSIQTAGSTFASPTLYKNKVYQLWVLPSMEAQLAWALYSGVPRSLGDISTPLSLRLVSSSSSSSGTLPPVQSSKDAQDGRL